MSVLLLKLAGPMQSWGERSRFTRRETGAEPTKSGVVGLLAAALGRQRTDPIEDLAGLRFGVRVDQPGSLLRDFQTAKSLDLKKVMPLSTRYYLSDAVFLAAVEGGDGLIDTIDDALRNPRYPLYLGRRSCPPAEPIRQAHDTVRSGTLAEVLANEPWRASVWYRHRVRHPRPSLTMVIDAEAAARWGGLENAEMPRTVADEPVSFDPRHRQYAFRSVVRGTVRVEHPDYRPDADRPDADRPDADRPDADRPDVEPADNEATDHEPTDIERHWPIDELGAS